MDQLYDDFINRVLPKIQEGLVITKDYFIDLFGRYVNYLLITDIITFIIFLIIFIISITFLYKKWDKLGNFFMDEHVGMILLTIVAIIASVIGFIGVIVTPFDIVKDIYIPEVRVYEELNNFNNN